MHCPAGHRMAMAREGRSGLNVSSLCPNCLDPIPDGLGNELWAVVGPDVGWHATQDEQVRESIDYLSRVQLPFHPDRQTFSAVFIQDVERPKGSAIIGSVVHEVIRPNVITILRAKPDT